MSNATLTFTQLILAHRSLTETQALQIYKRIIEHESKITGVNIPEPDSESLDSVIEQINSQMTGLEYEVRITHDQETGEKLYTFVNLQSSESTKFASDLSLSDLELMKTVMDVIYDPNHFKEGTNNRVYVATAHEIDVASENARSTNLESLASLVENGWLQTKGEKKFTLTNRALAELDKYIEETYGEDVERCVSCNELFTAGLGCKCGMRLHNPCLDLYKRQVGNGVCGVCKKESLDALVEV